LKPSLRTLVIVLLSSLPDPVPNTFNRNPFSWQHMPAQRVSMLQHGQSPIRDSKLHPVVFRSLDDIIAIELLKRHFYTRWKTSRALSLILAHGAVTDGHVESLTLQGR
jgi:hypothetical protein